MTPAREPGRGALYAGVAALALCAAGAAIDVDQFFRSWLTAFVFWAGIPLGCLAILMIQHVTGGVWGAVIRRGLEAGARTIPWMALAFLPLVFGMKSLYPWARPEVVAADALLRHKAPYLNVTFFLIRAAFYFAVWWLLAWRLSRMSQEQDRGGGAGLVRRMVLFSSGGLLAFVLTMTFASVDWVMSLEPRWVSTIYGPLLMAGQAVAAFCFAILVTVRVSRARDAEGRDLAAALTPDVLHDLGKLLFAFVMVWAYFALSQFLIIWSANLPEEIPWYLRRLEGGWQWVGLAVILLHFGVPFGLLLMRRVKRSADRLVRVLLLVLVMRVVDTWWMVAPAFGGGTVRLHWMDPLALIGMGGLFVHLFQRQLARMPLLPLNDPQIPAAAGEAAHP